MLGNELGKIAKILSKIHSYRLLFQRFCQLGKAYTQTYWFFCLSGECKFEIFELAHVRFRPPMSAEIFITAHAFNVVINIIFLHVRLLKQEKKSALTGL